MAKKPDPPPCSTPFDESAIPPEAPVKPKRNASVMDDELKTIALINRAVAKLPDESARIRVVRYIAAKLQFPLVDQNPQFGGG